MSTEPLAKSVQKHWKQGDVRNAFTTIAKYVTEHPEQKALEAMLTKIHSAMDAAGIKKGEKVEIHFKGRQESPKHHREGKCLFCPNHLRFKTKVAFSVDGKTLDFGRLGDLVGDECFSHFTYIVEAARRPGFKMYDMPDRERDKHYERLKKVNVTLEQLSPKAVRELSKEGFDLREEIPAALADEIQKQIMRGDFSGVRRETDTGKNKDIVQWGISNRRDGKIYDPAIIHTVNLLEHRPDRVTPEQWTAYLLYQWQEREFEAKTELGIVRDDILYLAKLQKEQPNHRVVRRHAQVDLDKKLDPVKIYNKARWEEITLGQILDEKRASVTKAQSRAAKHAVPRLDERRAYHNLLIVREYCKAKELNQILAELETRYLAERQRYANEKHSNPKAEPDWPWKRDASSVLEDFFIDNKQRIAQTDTKVTTQDILLKYVKMQDAQNVVRTLYTESRKLQLAQKTGDHVLGQSYTPVQDLNIPELEQKLDKLLNSALEIDKPTRDGRQRVQKTRMNAKTVKKLIEDVREAHNFGILPTKYVQPDSKQPSMLERALEITADYEKDDGTIAKHVAYLQQLETELGVNIKDVKASDGRTARRKSDARLKTSTYAGKTYFSKEQKTALLTLMEKWGPFPSEFRDLDIPKAKETIERVRKFYEEHKIYSNQYSGRWFHGSSDNVDFKKIEAPGNAGNAINYPPINEFTQEDKYIQEGHYTRVNAEIRKQLEVLQTERARRLHSYTIHIPDKKELEKILKDEKTLLAQPLVKAINDKYNAFMERARQVKQNRRELQSERCDVDVLIGRLEALKKRERNVRIPGREYSHWTPSIDETLKYLKDDLVALDKPYVHRIAEAAKPAALVTRQNYNLYQDAKNNYFDFVIECDLAEKSGEHLRKAFGKTRNEGKALLKWTENDERDIGVEKIIRVGPKTWYGVDRKRDYFERICSRAEEDGHIYVRIFNARDKSANVS